MPSTVNGIGTGYWGKSNIITRESFCATCHRFAQLKSYDTTKSIVVLFLPLIPLGRKRIVDYCPLCTHHRAISLKHWRQGRDQIVGEKLEAWRRNKLDCTIAKEVVAATIYFQSQVQFEEIAAELRRATSLDAELRVLLAQGYEYFGKLPEAEEQYRLALAAEPDTKVRGALVLNLLRQQRPDDAWPLLEEFIAEHNEAGIWFLQAQTECYQSLGRHDNALYVIEQTLAAFPAQQQNRTWKKLRQYSEKNFASGKTLKRTSLQTQSRPDLGSNRWVGMAGKLAIPALLALGLGYYLWLANDLGRHREVHVVNGLPVGYTVEIAGRPVKLAPLDRRVVEIPEGDIRVRMVSNEPALAEQTCRIATDFLTRPIQQRVYVINPDQAAIIAWEEVEYSVNPDPNSGSAGQVHIGKLLHEFTDVDYVFEEFPKEIELSSGHPQKRQRILQVQSVSPLDTLAYIYRANGEAAALKYFTALPLREADEDLICFAVRSVMDEKTLLAAMTALLDDRPVRIEAHRIYQDLMESHEAARDLQAEYRALLAREPENVALKYLLARVVRDPDESMKLMHEAASANPPLARAEAGIAFEDLHNARFVESLEHLRRGEQIAPHCTTLYEMEMLTLEMLDDAQAALDRLAQVRDLLPDAQLAIGHSAYNLARLNRLDEAKKLIAEWAQAGQADGADPSNLNTEARMRATSYYVAGQTDEAARILAELDAPTPKFMAAVIRGDWQAAATALESVQDKDAPYWHLLVALGAATASREGLSAAETALALEKLKTGDAEARQVAQWMAGDEPLDIQAALRLSTYPRPKCIALLALGKRFPEHRAACLALARQLNAHREFPYHTVVALLDGPAAIP